jgi:hypothetical protein
MDEERIFVTLSPMVLRVEAENGLLVEEYRILDREIQAREFQLKGADHAEWRTLSAAELTTHVMKRTVVSHWLQKRLGRRGLLRACVADQSALFGDAESERRAA